MNRISLVGNPSPEIEAAAEAARGAFRCSLGADVVSVPLPLPPMAATRHPADQPSHMPTVNVVDVHMRAVALVRGGGPYGGRWQDAASAYLVRIRATGVEFYLTECGQIWVADRAV